MYLKSFIFIISAVLLSACVTTDMSSYVDPEYESSGYQVRTVVVRALGAGLKETQEAETGLVEKFKSYGIDAVKFIDIVPPTREYSADMIWPWRRSPATVPSACPIHPE